MKQLQVRVMPDGISRAFSVDHKSKYEDAPPKVESFAKEFFCLKCLTKIERNRLFCEEHSNRKRTREEKEAYWKEKNKQIKEARSICEEGEKRNLARDLRRMLLQIRDRQFDLKLKIRKVREAIADTPEVAKQS